MKIRARGLTPMAYVTVAIVLLGGSIHGVAAEAQESPPAAIPAASTTQQRIAATGRRGFLFRVTRGTQSFYLYGGAVASNDDLFPFNAPLVQALERSQLLLIDHDPRWSVSEAIALGTLPPDQSLLALLSPAMLASTRQALEQAGIAFAPAEHFKPWLVAELLAQEQGERTGLRADHNTVTLLMAYARNAGLSLKILDAADDDPHVLNAMPMEVQVARLAQVISDVTTARGEQKVRDYAGAWASGDERALMAVQDLYAQPTYSAFTTWYWREFHPRHMTQLAAAVLQSLPASLNALVAIPALDLVGSTGLVQAFVSEGCTVKNLQP